MSVLNPARVQTPRAQPWAHFFTIYDLDTALSLLYKELLFNRPNLTITTLTLRFGQLLEFRPRRNADQVMNYSTVLSYFWVKYGATEQRGVCSVYGAQRDYNILLWQRQHSWGSRLMTPPSSCFSTYIDNFPCLFTHRSVIINEPCCLARSQGGRVDPTLLDCSPNSYVVCQPLEAKKSHNLRQGDQISDLPA